MESKNDGAPMVFRGEIGRVSEEVDEQIRAERARKLSEGASDSTESIAYRPAFGKVPLFFLSTRSRWDRGVALTV